MSKIARTFSVKGSTYLLNAFAQQIAELGFTIINPSLLSIAEVLISNHQNPTTAGQYKTLAFLSSPAVYHVDRSFELPRQWNEAVSFVKEEVKLLSKKTLDIQGKLKFESTEGGDSVDITAEGVGTRTFKKDDIAEHIKRTFDLSFLGYRTDSITFGCTTISRGDANRIAEFLR